MQHDNTGAGWMLREFIDTITRAADREGLQAVMGIYSHEQAREHLDISDTLKEFIDTTMRRRKSEISETLKRICEHDNAREASAVFAVPKKGSACCRECLSDALCGPWAGFRASGDKLKGEPQNEIKNRSIQRDHAGERAYN